jgi:hypothetical protein
MSNSLPTTRHKKSSLNRWSKLSPYLKAFKVDLFLSASEEDVQSTIDAGVAAGMIYKESGSEAFLEHEKKNAMKLLPNYLRLFQIFRMKPDLKSLL